MPKQYKKGYASLLVLIFLAIFVILVVGMLVLINSQIHLYGFWHNSSQAFFLAESGIERAMAYLRDTETIPAQFTFALADTGLLDKPELDNIVITVTSAYQGGNVYLVTSTATVSNSTRTIQANIMHNPPSKVFDYPYFINNWGWLFGSGITVNGDVRSNGDFDFDGPRIEGEVYAGQEIHGGDTITGKAGTEEDGEYIYQHPNSPVLNMPNLQNLDYYKQEAMDRGGYIKIGDDFLVSAVYGDDAGETGNMVLIGTPSNPIEVNGPVVITGDVVVKGTVKGQGAIYAGRNVYIADNVNYKNAPSSPRPASDDPDVVDGWVEAHKDDDMVGFAASESVVLGDYTGSTGGAWYADQYLFSMGNEDVGEDGIPGTEDEGEGDGVFQSEYEDLDEDDVFDTNYDWSRVQTQVPIDEFTNVQAGVSDFGDLASNNVNKLEGVFYTNHAFAGRTGKGVHINGAIISKDEAIIYRNTIVFNYDERAHSRYRCDPNWLIDLKLPVSERTAIVGWWE